MFILTNLPAIDIHLIEGTHGRQQVIVHVAMTVLFKELGQRK